MYRLDSLSYIRKEDDKIIFFGLFSLESKSLMERFLEIKTTPLLLPMDKLI